MSAHGLNVAKVAVVNENTEYGTSTAEAINRAGSTAPAKIQAALCSQDVKPDQLMIGYKGVKYGSKGQNFLAATLLVQLDGSQ